MFSLRKTLRTAQHSRKNTKNKQMGLGMGLKIGRMVKMANRSQKDLDIFQKREDYDFQRSNFRNNYHSYWGNFTYNDKLAITSK